MISSRRVIPAGTVLLSALLLSATAAPGQESATCGWHFLEPRDVPASVRDLVARAPALGERQQTALDQLMEWYRECDHTEARRAAMSLRSERSRTNSRDPVLRALLGITLVRGPEVHVLYAEGGLLRPINRHTNAEIEGVRLLAAVVEDTGWPEVVEELAAVAVITGKSGSLDEAARALAAVPDSMRDARYWMAAGEVALARGNADSALTAMTHIDVEHARAARIEGLARMLIDADPRVGGDIYLRGLAAADDAVSLQRYFDDLRLLLGEDERRDWDDLEDGRAAWIRRKWEWRAMLSGIRVADRLAANQRRLAYVLENYRRTSYRGAAVPTSIWADSIGADVRLIDDRGMIYLLHGAPSAEMRMIGSERLAWVYSREGPVQPVYEFDRGPDRSDWFLAEPYPICGGRHVATMSRRMPGTPPAGEMADWAARLERYDPALASYYRDCERDPMIAGDAYMPLLGNARVNAARMLNSENSVPDLPVPLTASMNLYAFDAGEETELVAYLAVQGGTLNGLNSVDDTTLSYALRVQLAAGDPVSESIARVDTLLAFTRAEPLPATAVVATAIPLHTAPARNARITLSLRNGFDATQGQVMATSRTIPAFDEPMLSISDVVIAEPRDGTWSRGEYSLAPAQGHALLEGSAFRMYYEVYNVQAGDPLTVRVVVAPGSDASVLARLESLIAKRSALTVDFAEDAVFDADGVMRSGRDVTADLQPGAYDVLVVVRNTRTGETANRNTNLVIVER